MKTLFIFLFFLGAVPSGSVSMKADNVPAPSDTTIQYVVDYKRVEGFDGSQLNGKCITSYKVDTVNTAKGVILRHSIVTDEAVPKNPVIVLDGKVISRRRYEKLDPASIESITIVKNGSVESVKKYPGWENGVILIETKSVVPIKENKDKSVQVGYGKKVEKEELTYSVQSVKVDENVFARDIYEYLQGKVPGLYVQDHKICIRGINSMNSSSEPLILVDGVEVGRIDIINPADVYSVDVMKDASSSIYGVKGANGVLLITTKAGQRVKEQEAAARKAEKAARKAERAARKK